MDLVLFPKKILQYILIKKHFVFLLRVYENLLGVYTNVILGLLIYRFFFFLIDMTLILCANFQ